MRQLLIVGTIRQPCENPTLARPVMQRMVETTRAEDGCYEYSYAEHVLEPGLIHVKELWLNQAALDRHIISRNSVQPGQSWGSAGVI